MVSLPLLQASLLAFLAATASGSFVSEIDLTWGGQRGKITENGELLTLSLDHYSGSGFQSKHEYLFGRIDMKMKLVPGNSAGTVTTLYLSSQGPTHDEIDFEFLGNVTGEPYVLHTNVYAQGKGNKEKQFYLWFDPRADFHTYSILWNPKQILFSVDNVPLRVFKNTEAQGVPFPKSQPMRLYSSLWDAEDWATRGGREKTDWSAAPFTASYRGFAADACVWATGRSICSASTPWHDQVLDTVGAQKMKAVQDKYMIYDYCKDAPRFPQGIPVECSKAF